MDPETRAQLYDTLQQCCVDLKSGHEILALIDSIAAEGNANRSTDFADTDEEIDTYEDTWVYESGRSLRSCAGYVGTVNLSNTCYSNSLFTQLYMNVPFREFILDLNVSDDDEQRLLRELRKMFADMQYSWQRAYNPENLIGSILNYEGQSIDPNIQMDADEFYNLLFDRLEAQLPTQQTRQAFKRFYGGQLVQQIRSKDCGHVSEREEAFSAIQCEIKNKATLEDSLLAYVQGEVLEGDNKYKCATCDQKVDAVKRSCLKDLPDNLIFHLKRFDFDLRTLTRSKINDVFQFPDAINMTPYTVDQLNDCSQILPLDVFDLVGVLVHSGTAESGHYYSYIRERPTRNIRAPRWLEFNDTEVGTLDFSQLGSQCFGGNEASTLPGFQYPMPKIYSAYMLFYERRSSLESKQNRCQSSGLSIPRIIPLPRELNEVTIEENASILRYHCLHVDAHLEFVRWLIVRLASWKPVDCTSTHDLERFAVGVVLQHLTTVVSRISNDPKNLKARPRHLDEIMTALRHFLSNCPVCHGLVLEWTIDDAVGLESLLLKCPKPPVRDAYRELLCVCLSASRTISEDNLEPNQDYAQWFTGLTGRLYHMWTITVPRFPKSWTEYWRLIAYIARMGTYEAGELLRMGFLSRSMHILGLESIKPLPHEYDNIARGFSRKKAAFAGLVDLTSALIQYIDLSRIQDQSLLDDESRAMNGPNELGKFPLSKSENVLWRSFERNERSRTLKVMDKMLSADITRTEEIDRAIHLFIARLAESDPQTSLPLWVKDTLAEGIYIDPAYLAGPYLQAAVSFCEYCPTEELCQSLFKEVISAFRHMPSLGGEELLHFYKTIIRTPNVCWDGEAAWRMRRLAILHTSDWGLRLLQYTGDPRIREEVDRFLREVIYDGCHPHIEGAPTSVPIVDHDQPTGNEGSGTDHRLATKSAPPSMAFVMPIHQPAPHSSGSLEVEAPSTNEGASSPVNTLVEETGDSEDLRSTADISPSPESTYHEPSGLTSLQKRESARLLYRRLLTSCEYQVSLAITQTNASTPVDGCLPLPTTVGPMNIGLLKIVGTLLSSSMSALQSLGPYIGSDLLESEARAGCAVSPTHAAVVSSAGLVVTAKTWEERAEEICTVVELGLNLAQHADGQASDDDEGDFESDEDVEDDDATTYSN